jgi:gliding motility-associated-like protein
MFLVLNKFVKKQKINQSLLKKTIKMKFFIKCCLLFATVFSFSLKTQAQATITVDTIIHATCNTSADGVILISVAGTLPFTYQWSSGAITQDVTGLFSGSYVVTVTDGLGAVSVSNILTINGPPVINVITDTVIHILCSGDSSGAVDLTVFGGTPGYTYIWGNGETTQDVTGLPEGPINVTVTDANGCVASAKSIFLDSIPPIIITLDSIDNVSCNGAADGAVFVQVTGGTGGTYNYLWSNGTTTQNLTGLSGGSYSVTVTDSNSCVMLSGPHIVNEPAVLVVTFDSLQNVDCNGNGNGAVFITVTGGTTNYTYNWSNGDLTEDITGLNGGAYSVTVTDANGCVDSTGPHIINEPTQLTLTLDSIQHVDCNGNSNGGVFVTVAGGTTSYTYAWSNTATTQDITGLNGGSYTLTVTDANGCTISDTAYVVNEPTALVATLDSVVNVSCNAFGDGGVFVSVAGGTTNYNYLWSNGITTEDNPNLGGGSYTLTVTDANGCSLTSGPHIVVEPAGMTVTLDGIVDVTCNGTADGSVSVSLTGGVPNYTYLWSNLAVTEDITGLNGGSYTLTVTDANGCTISSGPHLVNEDSLLVITLDSINHVSCNGANDGDIGISVTGGVLGYTYLWSNTAVTQDINTLAGGSYTLTVTDGSGCTAIDTAYVVNEPTVLVVTFDSLQMVDCNGANNGAVFMTTTGGTTNYTFLWSNGAVTEDITGLSAGPYTLTVTDANGCVTISATYIISEPTAVVLALDSIDNVTCNGTTDGAVFITATGGTTGYTYLWSNTAVTQNITGLNGGSYTVTVTDANGCTAISGPHVVTEATALVITLDSIDNVTCNGAADGAVFITATGGVTGYTYAWSNAGTTQNITGLNGGSYTITVTDAAGCTATSGPHVVNEPAQLVATLDSIVPVNCNGANDGAVFISIGGGTTPFSYLWSNSATTQDITNLIAGSYTVTVTDSSSCVVISGPHIVTEPTSVVLTLDSIDNVTCNGTTDGAVFITATGGTTGYTYLWSNAAVTQNITGLNGGSYTVTVTDANGCTATLASVTIGEPNVLNITVDTFKNESCFGIVDGFINTTATGGTTPYSYLWSNGAITDDITGLIAGTYTITVTDSNSCIAIDSITINDIPNITATLDGIDSVSCNGLTDGAVDITTTLGALGYTWLWSTGAVTEDITAVIAGNYIVTITDAFGCTITAGAYTVEEPAVLAISLDNIANVSCNGAADGAVTLTTTGGTSTYTYAWSNGQTTEDITGLSASSNTVTVTDFNGCTATSGAHVVSEATGLVIILDNIDSVNCNGASDGAVAISVNGGTPTYTYDWNNGAGTNEDLVNVNGNSYTVTVTDAAGCTLTSGPHVVDEPAALSLTITPTVPLEGCLGEPFGVLDATVTGGVGTINYQWSNAINTASNAGLNTGVYGLTVTDGNGCSTTGTDSIQDPVIPIVNPFVGQAPIIDTTINWSDVINIDAGNDQTANGVTYIWTDVTTLGNVNFANSTGASTTVNPEPTMSGTYTLLVTATSGDGCTDAGSVSITIEVNDFIGMPTAFTPNGDGINDFFRPANLDEQFILEFKVYNRWGQIIFDDTSTTAQWDGTFNGVEQPTESYIYVFRYKSPGQEERVLRGAFNLLR